MITDALKSLARYAGSLLGPEPLGEPLDLSSPLEFASWNEANGPWHDRETGEEILMRDGPTKRYGVGVLYPPDNDIVDVAVEFTESDEDELPAEDEVEIVRSSNATEDLKLAGGQPDDDDFDLTAANQYRPSAMAISFLIEMGAGDRLLAHTECGRYEPLKVQIGDKEHTWWVRHAVTIASEWTFEALHEPGRPHTAQASNSTESGLKSIKAQFEAFARPRDNGTVLVTVVLRNKSDSEQCTGGQPVSSRVHCGCRRGRKDPPLPEPAKHTAARTRPRREVHPAAL